MADHRFTRKEIAERGSNTDVVFIIDNGVYDVSTFIDEHPGGHEVHVAAAGKDISERYHEIGHSLEAKELMKTYKIGELVDEDKVEVKKKEIIWYPQTQTSSSSTTRSSQSIFFTDILLPLLTGAMLPIVYYYLFR